jgi:signal transduction histidine kinase
MSYVEQLRATPLFAELPERALELLCARAEPMQLRAGEMLIEEGSVGDSLFVVLSGELDVSKRSGDGEMPLARVGPGALQGEMAAIEERPRTASVRAVGDAEVLRVPREALLDVLGSGPEAALAILRTVLDRLRSTESLLRQREKLAALGTLSAGLAHELNNPAAAIRRSAAALADALRTRDALPRPARLPAAPPQRAPLGALARADAIDDLAALTGDDEQAAALVHSGWTLPDLEPALEGLDADGRKGAIAWIAANASVESLIHEIQMAGGRIGEIVSAVKAYAYLDQAPVQRVDLNRGLEDTLLILGHRLKEGVSVQRELADDLPQIEAYGSELNQVWTNLIDNALDAMGGRGELLVRTEALGPSEVRVSICDSGPGIPPDVQERIFEPFFTTKAPGIGTGLGLHISHNVIARQGGRLEVESQPGSTCFRATLPTTLPASASKRG